jgi:hypothetical protein
MVPNRDVTLVFSFIGYASQNVPVNGRSSIDISLTPDVRALNEVVVNASGIEKETKTLTYATQKISGAEILRVKEVNFVNPMAGKVAGAVITPGTMGPGTATRILIRGDKSFTGNSAPPYVIAVNPETCTVTLSSDNLKAIPINIRFPEYLHATAKSPSITDNGNGMFKLTDQVDHLVFNISND